MPHIFDPQKAGYLNSEERSKILPPEEILNFIGLCKDQVFVDIGAGAGFFTIPASRIVGENGRVIAIDISEQMLSLIREKINEKHRNVELMNSNAEQLNLPDSFADHILMSNVLHEIENKTKALKEAYRILKHNGKIAVLDWEKIPQGFGPPIEDRVSSNEVFHFLEGNGFACERKRTFGKSQYLIVARKN